MQSGNKEQLTSTVKQLYKYSVFPPKIPPIKVQWVLSPRQCTQKKKKEKHTYKSNTLTISLKTQSTGKNSINFDVKNLTAPPQRTAYIFSYTYKCAYVCVCVCERFAKNKFPYHFLCKSFGKQTEMCIKLQQCNKLRDAKVQQNNADWDGDVDGERWPERSAHCQISRVSTASNPPQVQWYAKNCMSLRWQRYVDPYPRGPPGRSTVFYVVRSLKNWQFDRSLCVCIVIVITVCCSYNSSAKSLISWWPRRLCPRPAPVFLGLQLVWSHCCGRVGSLDEPRIKSDAFLYEVYIFTNIKQIMWHLINSLRFICKQGE